MSCVLLQQLSCVDILYSELQKLCQGKWEQQSSALDGTLQLLQRQLGEMWVWTVEQLVHVPARCAFIKRLNCCFAGGKDSCFQFWRGDQLQVVIVDASKLPGRSCRGRFLLDSFVVTRVAHNYSKGMVDESPYIFLRSLGCRKGQPGLTQVLPQPYNTRVQRSQREKDRLHVLLASRSGFSCWQRSQ